MSKGKIIGGVVVAVIVLAAIGSAAAPKNALAPTSPPTASSVAAASNAAPSVDVTASASAGTAAYAVGDRVKLGDEEYITIEKAEKGFTSDLVKPAAGNVNVSFLVAFEGINPSGASYNPFYFKVADENGFEYNYNVFGKDPQLASGNSLQPGKIVRGWMTFEIPKTIKTLTLTYTPNLIGEPVEFVYKP